MPELPEVEVISRQLNKSLTGLIIKSFECNWVKMIKPLGLIKFKKKILGQKVLDVKRRAKVILINFKNGHLAIHLKMTGQLVYIPKHGKVIVGGHPIAGLNNTPNKFTHASFTFKNGAHLYFNDMRKFGWIKWLEPKEHLELHKSFGLEGLSGHAKILEILLKNRARFPKKSIKGYLLDQTIISGLGNIYADEVCFMARILPSRQVQKITNAEWKNISKFIPQILNKSIRLGGTTFSTYRDGFGRQGSYWKSRMVYGRAGEKCERCGGIIKKTTIASRGTSYCPKCQH